MADGHVTIKVTVDGKEVELQLDKIEDQIEKTGDTASEAAEKATRDTKAMALALSTVTAALVAAGLKAYDMASAYDAAFAKTRTVMDETAVSAGDMRSSILDLSRDSAMAAEDVSQAVYQAISGSVDTADAVQFVDKANKLAVAGFTSLNNATDVLTTTLNAYHLSAEKVDGISNVLIRTQNLGKTSVDELAVSMGKSIATGSAYNVSLENLSTAYVELTRNGIATAESTTYINSMLNELGDSGKTVGKILQEQTGKSFGQLMQEGWSLADVLGVLMESVDGNTEALIGLWGSQEAGKAANAIVSQSLEDFNQVLATMNAEMAGATGTTEKAYETMTSTSEFIDRRLNNSVKNLAISYGEMLAPPMDAIKTLGADILEGLTDLINKSPLAASAIAAVSTGVTVLAGGLAALLIVEKIKDTFAAFNLTLTSSPVLLAVAGISALAIGITTLIANTKEENQYLEEFNTKLKDMKDSLNNSIAATEVTVDQVGRYVDRLKELEAAGLNTTEEQEEYHAILVKLTQTIPELSDIIDLETDTIKGGTQAIEENTAAWEKNAKEQAYQKYLADVEEARTKALIDRTVAEKKLNAARERSIQLGEEEARLLNLATQISVVEASGKKEYTNAIWAEVYANQRLNELYQEKGDLYVAVYAALDELVELGTTEEKTIKDSEAALRSCDEVLASASDEYEIAKQVIDELIESEQENAEATETVTEKTDALGDALHDAAEKASEIREKTPAITNAIQSWADKYGDLYKAAKESLEKQFKLWEEAERVSSVSVEKANKGIQSQIDYWHRYNDDLQTIKDSGIAGMDQLFKFISDGSPDSIAMAAGIAEAIRSGNQPAVEELIGLYQDLQTAQTDTAEVMFQMQNDMDDALNELVGSVDAAVGDMNMPDAAWNAAHETVLAYAKGLYSGTADVEQAAHAVASSAASALSSGRSSSGYGSGPRATAYASGTDYAAAGLALVGEEGPELIYLRGGERILTADETRNALRGLYELPSAATSFSGSAAPAAVGGAPVGDRKITVIVPVEVDGRELARATATTMGEEMLFDGY